MSFLAQFLDFATALSYDASSLTLVNQKTNPVLLHLTRTSLFEHGQHFSEDVSNHRIVTSNRQNTFGPGAIGNINHGFEILSQLLDVGTTLTNDRSSHMARQQNA